MLDVGWWGPDREVWLERTRGERERDYAKLMSLWKQKGRN